MSTPGELLFEQPSEDTLRVILSGPWKLGKELPSAGVVLEKLKSARSVRDIGIDAQGVVPFVDDPVHPGGRVVEIDELHLVFLRQKGIDEIG